MSSKRRRVQGGVAVESAVVLVTVAVLGLGSMVALGHAGRDAIAGEAAVTGPGTAARDGGAMVLSNQAALLDGAFVRAARTIVTEAGGALDAAGATAQRSRSVLDSLPFLDRVIARRGLNILGDSMELRSFGHRLPFMERAVRALDADGLARLGENFRSLTAHQSDVAVFSLHLSDDALFQRMVRGDTFFEHIRQGRFTQPWDEFVLADGKLRSGTFRATRSVTRADHILESWARPYLRGTEGASLRFEIPAIERDMAEYLRALPGTRITQSRTGAVVHIYKSAFPVYP